MVDRETLKYLTRKAFVESKRKLVHNRVPKWHTRIVCQDGIVYVMPPFTQPDLQTGGSEANGKDVRVAALRCPGIIPGSSGEWKCASAHSANLRQAHVPVDRRWLACG